MKYIVAFLLLSTGFIYGENQQTTQIMLYYSPRCPYSLKVLSYLKDNDIKIPMKNVQGDEEAKQELIDQGGYAVVPCLIVDGEAIYDANKIIDWLSAHPKLLSAFAFF